MVGALYGRRLCENTVGLLEEKGVSTWQSAGAVDKTEWVHQIRTLTTIFPPYQLQEDGHPNYWGQLALRNCFRQAVQRRHAPDGGYCSRGTGLNGKGEPNMTLDVGVRSGAWSAGSLSSRVLAGGLLRPAGAGAGPAPLRRRDVRVDLAPADPGAAERPEDRHRVPPVPGEGRDRAADRRRRGRAGLPVDRDPRRVPLDLRAAAEQPLAAARRQPRDRRLGADRLQERAVVRGPHVRAARSRGGRAGARPRSTQQLRRGASSLFATKYAVDDLAAVLRALEIEEFDLYGDSYGTFFVQDFIARHPAACAR